VAQYLRADNKDKENIEFTRPHISFHFFISKNSYTDKAKSRGIGGRKATGLQKTAGLPYEVGIPAFIFSSPVELQT